MDTGTSDGDEGRVVPFALLTTLTERRTPMPCCSGFCAETQRRFDARVAGRDLDRYRRKCPQATARILCQIIVSRKPMRGMRLDIGALTFELLNAGFGHATAVDASSAYVAAGREETVRRGLTDDVNWIEGDCVNLASQLMPAHVVTLDRVVCCYPAYEPLLETALDHAWRMVRFRIRVTAGMSAP